MTTEKAEPDTLLACPFCGRQPMITDGELWEISCESFNCAAAVVTRGGKFLEAAKAWNTRAAPAQYDAQSVRAATIEECAKVCDLHAKWADDRAREDEAPESVHNQLFATIGNTASSCAGSIRALSETKPAQETFKPCVIYTEEIRLTEMILEDTLIVWQPWGPFEGHAVDCGYSTDGRLVGIQIWDDVRTKRPTEPKPAQGDAHPERPYEAQVREALKHCRDFKVTDSNGKEVLEDSLHEIRKVAGRTLAALSETKPARRALRDIISIARDANATDALGDIVKRAEEELGTA